jgi:RHS repeat-associated protein
VLSSGEAVLARSHTLTTFDAAAPGGATYNLATRVDAGVRVRGEVVDRDIRSTTYAYDGQTNLGWALRAPTTVTIDPGGLGLQTVTLYDPTTGAATEIRRPANTAGGDPRTTRFITYTADASATDPVCRNAPAWAGLPCRTTPGGQPASGSPLAVQTTTAYNRFGAPTTTVEDVAAGGTTRTTTTTYDLAGRPSSVVTVGAGASPGASVPASVVGYDPTTGLPVTVSTTVGGVTSTITHGYDALGRLTSYTDADANVATTTYDIADRPLTVSDGKGTETIAYNQGSERRGLPTTITDSAVGAFTATYDSNGGLAQQAYPNGATATLTTDEAGTPTRLVYAKSGAVWLDFQNAPGSTGRLATTASTLSQQAYRYDNAGRLSHVEDTTSGSCTTRDYGFDADSNRTSLTTRPSLSGGDCATTGGVTTSHAYDSADRITDAGYTLDPLGRITQAPAADAGGQALSASYFVNDRIQSLTQNGRIKTWTLDPLNRARVQTDTLDASTRTNHSANDSDSPAWTADTSTSSTWTRNITAFTGLAATQTATSTELELVDLLGNVVATASTSTGATAPTSTFESDEFGNPRSAATHRYGWIGAVQRETTLGSGVALMGQRVYLPGSGRFLQPDPVRYGSANDYDYANQDPINQWDPTGQWSNSDTANSVMLAMTIASIAFPEADLMVIALRAVPGAARAVAVVVRALIKARELLARDAALADAADLASVTMNRAAGNLFRDEVAGRLAAIGFNIIGTEVRVGTGLGARIIDILAERNGSLIAFETKLGSSRYLASQRAKDWWIANVGGELNGAIVRISTLLIRGPFA